MEKKPLWKFEYNNTPSKEEIDKLKESEFEEDFHPHLFNRSALERPSLYDWEHKPTEEGLLFTKNGKRILMTSEPYWNKPQKQSHP